MTWRRAALYAPVLCTHATAKPVAEAAAIPCAEPSVKVQPNLPPGSQASLQPSLWLENFAISTYAVSFVGKVCGPLLVDLGALLEEGKSGLKVRIVSTKVARRANTPPPL